MSMWGVHATRVSDVGRTEVVFDNVAAARDHARARSTDGDVSAASVTEYTVNQLGRRTPAAMFVNGVEQKVPYVSDCRQLFG